MKKRWVDHLFLLFFEFHVIHVILCFATVFVSATCYLCLFFFVGQGEIRGGGRWQSFS